MIFTPHGRGKPLPYGLDRALLDFLYYATRPISEPYFLTCFFTLLAAMNAMRFRISATTAASVGHAVKGLAKELFQIPSEKAAEIPNGHGGIGSQDV